MKIVWTVPSKGIKLIILVELFRTDKLKYKAVKSR